jgi:uncharacterized 2Fe-2S/4Fe-4S cluster protein (DUF4445 family)
MLKCNVTFIPEGIVQSIPAGKTIMDAAAKANVKLEGPCGGKGTCGKCRVLITNTEEKNDSQWVLACQTIVKQDLMVEIPQTAVSSHRKSLITDQEIQFDIKPNLKKIRLCVKKATLEHPISDADRVLEMLDGTLSGFSFDALKALPTALRENNGEITVTLNNHEILVVEPGNRTEDLFGIAVDIGTTTVVVSLVNLLTGETLSTASGTNTQNIFGANVISRIEHVSTEKEGLKQLQSRVVNVMNSLITILCKECNLLPQSIVRAIVAGNTIMGHLLLGLDPTSIAPAPFTPVLKKAITFEAQKIGLGVYPSAPVTLLPNISGYVGADTVAVMLATKIDEQRGVTLVIDIGTNGEMVLGINGKLLACSTAAGPAFEGAHIRYGMLAATGAIERVVIDQDVTLQVINHSAPKGICGSGLIDAIAQMVQAGIIDESGKLLKKEEATSLPECLSERLGEDSEGRYFILAYGKDEDHILITQKDIRELQLAKAAVRAGIEVMLKHAELSYREIDRVLLAGAFGNYIEKQSALQIGLFPPLPVERVSSIGNAAGLGAKVALLSVDQLTKAQSLANEVQHIELSTQHEFQELFIDSLAF